jgi:competence protein ComEA
MDESRAGWRTFGETDGPGRVGGGPAPGSGDRQDPAGPGDRWAGPPDAARAWAGRVGADGVDLADAHAAGPWHVGRVIPLAIAAAAGAVLAGALLVVALGTGGAAAVVVEESGTAAPGPASSETAAVGIRPPEAAGASAVAAGSDTDSIVVDVEGAVPRPGLVRLPAGARVGDAIAAAGGYAPTVDVGRAAGEVNLAARVSDGDHVHVPAMGDAPATTTGTADGTADGGSQAVAAGAAPGLVDVNRASASELDALPGIGPVTADKIIKARATAPFRTVQELRDRKVVTAATYAKIAPLVTVGP